MIVDSFKAYIFPVISIKKMRWTVWKHRIYLFQL